MSSRDYTQKIRNILNESSQTVPQIFQRFYTILKLITLSIRQQNQDSKIFDQYSLIYKTFKKWLIDQPYTLISRIQKIEKQLKVLISPLIIFIPEDALSKKILQFFIDKEISKQINSFLDESERIKSQLLAKNVKLKVFGTHQLANAFWIKKFNNQFAVHIDNFWISFLEFIEEINFFGYFVSVSSKKSIIKRVDPQKKYFVTSSNVNQLFYKLSEPKFLQQLADETAKGIKPLNFSSKDFLELKFLPVQKSVFQTKLKQNENFQISGEDTLIDGLRVKAKNPPTVIFGSSNDSDVKIKNKYVSRKQFMIIEEDQKFPNNKGKQSILPFSLVCLSSSNFTAVSYNRKQKLKAGMIFKIDSNSIQVVKIQNLMKQIYQASQSSQSEDEQTLQYLPVKRNKQFSLQKQAEYLCISGPKKGMKGKFTKQNLKLNQQINDNQQINVQYIDDQFYLPPGIKILVKTANQVINGYLSDKIPLQQEMNIILEECQFQII